MSVQLTKKLETSLLPELKQADEVYIAVAIMTHYGLDFLNDNTPKEARVKLLVGIDLLTPISVFEELLRNAPSNWEVRVFRKKAYFHTKLYIIEKDEPICFVGSGNFTEGGLSKHVEIFSKIQGSDVTQFKEWFNLYFGLGELINQDFIEEYRPLFERAAGAKANATRSIGKLKRGLLKRDNPDAITLEDIDFTTQYFKYEHFNAFSGAKPYAVDEQTNEERLVVRQKLYDLHDLLYPEIMKRKWDLHEHGDYEHVVSSYKHGIYTTDDLSAVWLHYGRSPHDLKKFKKIYGENQSSRFQMRLQVLVREKEVSIWLTVGKDGGAVVDRENFKTKMREDENYRASFFKLFKKLPNEYFIHINDEYLLVNEVVDSNHLYEFTKHDDIHQHYFIIGKHYSPDSEKISESNIVSTILSDFEMLYPIYIHLRTVLK